MNASLSAALDRIAERAADVRRAFTPGAVPRYGDVATATPSSKFALAPLSVAAPEGTYFVTRDARGRTQYSRDGAFSLSDGTLSDALKRPVLGRSAPGAALHELHVDPVDAALGVALNPRVLPDGSFVYTRAAIDPRSGTRVERDVTAGRVALARFPAATRLDGDDGSHFSAPSGVAPHVGLPGDGAFGPIVPLARERSRVDLDASLARLKDAYVAFDALAAAETARDHLSKTAMDVVK